MSREAELASALSAYDDAAASLVAESSTWADKPDGTSLYLGSGDSVSKQPIRVGELRALVRAAHTARALLLVPTSADDRGDALLVEYIMRAIQQGAERNGAAPYDAVMGNKHYMEMLRDQAQEVLSALRRLRTPTTL